MLMSAVMLLLFISAMSAMLMVGPRVYAAMAKDGFLPAALASLVALAAPSRTAVAQGVSFTEGRPFAEALRRARAEKKPLIVSMADVAASGGYYIACNATRVFALPTTLTGSIGVFSFKLVTEGLYNKLGARRQTVKRGEHADAMSDMRTMTPEEDSMMQAQVDYFYNQFVQKVATGRKMSFEAVDSIGQGRIWSGLDAKRIGIVDSLGGFLDAVESLHGKELSFNNVVDAQAALALILDFDATDDDLNENRSEAKRRRQPPAPDGD